MRFNLGQCAEWCGGKLVGDGNLHIDHVMADSRLCCENSIFVCIKGPNFNGADFIDDAFEKGAVAVIVEDEEVLGGRPGVVCNSSIEAIGNLAREYRKTLDIPWVAVTGSNGKTTTRQMLACILRHRGEVACSTRNYNNNIGVPLSILSIPDGAWAGVIELGTNAPGEIKYLAEILQPTAGIITSIGKSHLEGLGSVENVAHEKGSLLESLCGDAFAVFPAEGEFCDVLCQKVNCHCRKVGLEGDADIFASEINIMEDMVLFDAWETHFEIPVLGKHNVRNALSAIAMADFLGITPEDASVRLKKFKEVSGRMNIKKIGSLNVIDDTYNANPDSLKAAIDFMVEIPARRHVVILGPMRELGEHSDKLHRESGLMIARSGIDLLLVCGKETMGLAEAASLSSARCKVHYLPAAKTLMNKLKSYLDEGDFCAC